MYVKCTNITTHTYRQTHNRECLNGNVRERETLPTFLERRCLYKKQTTEKFRRGFRGCKREMETIAIEEKLLMHERKNENVHAENSILAFFFIVSKFYFILDWKIFFFF